MMAIRARPLLILFAGYLIHFSLGIGPTFGNILPYLVSYVRADSKPSSLRYTDAAYVYSCQLAGWGMSSLLGGLLERRLGPRIVTFMGGLLMSIGSFASYFAVSVNYWILTATFGLCFGIGTGLSFICPLSCAIKWYPKWKGVATGVISCGFASGGIAVPFVQTFFINPHNQKPDMFPDPLKPEEKYFTQREILDRVPYVFLIIGGICALFQFVGMLLLSNPPSTNSSSSYGAASNDRNPKPAINTDANVIRKGNSDSKNSDKISFTQVLKRPIFYTLLLIFFVAATSRAFIRALYKAYGLEEVANDDLFMTIVLVTGSVASLIARVPWGFLADVTSFKFALVLQAAFTTCLMATLYSTSAMYKVMYLLWMMGISFCFGGCFSIFPVAIAQIFGKDNVGLVYGMVFIGQGLGGVLAACISHILVDIIHWYGVFFILTGLNVASYLIILCIPINRYVKAVSNK